MSIKTSKYKTSTLLFLAVPIFLLVIFSFMFKIENASIEADTSQINPYLKQMPITYSNMLDGISKKKEGFKYHIIDNNFNRRIIIFLESPQNFETNRDFNLEVYPNKNLENSVKAEKINYKLTNNASIYQYRNKKYAVFNFNLPYFEIDKLELKQLKKTETILYSFKEVIKPTNISFSKNNKGIKSEPNLYLPLLCNSLQKNNISYAPYSYKTEGKSLFVVTENVKDYINSTQSVIIQVKKPNLFWHNINQKKEVNITVLGKDKAAVNALFKKHITGKIELNQLINLKKLIKFQSLLLLYTGQCTENLFFIYNKKDNILEPFFNGSKCVGKESKFIKKPQIHNPLYIKEYINELNNTSKKVFSNDLVFSNKSVSEEINLINTKFPEKVFDIDYIIINQKKINKSLHRSSIINAEFVSINSKELILDVTNLSFYPVRILGLNYNTQKVISKLDNPEEILSGKKKTITIDLPRSFENLFVSKKSKKTGFVLSKHIHNLQLTFKTSGLEQEDVNYVSILPYQEKEVIKEDLFRDKKNINNHKDIIVNNNRKSITFSKKNIVISKPLIIPEGYVFDIKQGTTIDIVEGGKIISYAPLRFIAPKNSPITFTSSDNKGQGIIVLSSAEESKLQYVNFNNLRNLSHGNWSVSGAVTFYESPVDLKYVTVSNNKCEDALNIIRTTFTMKNCTISNTQSDAFDGDFVTGTIIDSKFINLGNDAIDVSGSDLKIINVDITNAGDKGLSAGEDSKMTVNNVTITSSEIAIAGKDLSIINAKNIHIKNTKLAFTAFQKKPEFGPSQITVNKVKMDSVETVHLVENTSVLILDNKKVESSSNVKERMYGAEFGVSSDKTRNSQ